MAITVTSKYKPFTYEELVKPLEGYWKKYDEAEEDLTKLKTDTAVLQSVIDSMPEGEEKTKYTNYLSSLNSQAEALANQGLTSNNRTALRDLQVQYGALIPRLSLAEEARRKDITAYKQRANSGEYFMDSGNSPINRSVVDYLDGNMPLYNSGIKKKDLGTDVENVAKAYSSRIFPETSIEEVEKVKNKFIKVTQEQGVNADFSQIEGNEQFMPILNALYEQYGIDKMTGEEQSLAKDFVNRKFWEGLVYKKAEDYQKNATTKDSSRVVDLKMTDKDGNPLVSVGGRVISVTGQNPDGTWIVSPWSSKTGEDKPTTKAEGEFSAYKKNMLIGYDRKSKDRLYTPGAYWDPKKYDETRILYSPSSVVSLYSNSILKGKDNVEKPKFTKVVEPGNMTAAYETAKRHTFNETDKGMHTTHNIPITDLVGFHTGGHSKTGGNEFLGDNHISLIFADTFIEELNNTALDSSEKLNILKDIRDKYYTTNTQNPYRIVTLADNEIKNILYQQLSNTFTKDTTGKVIVNPDGDPKTVLDRFKEYLNIGDENSILSSLPKPYVEAYKEYQKNKDEQLKGTVSSSGNGTQPNIEGIN